MSWCSVLATEDQDVPEHHIKHIKTIHVQDSVSSCALAIIMLPVVLNALNMYIFVESIKPAKNQLSLLSIFLYIYHFFM